MAVEIPANDTSASIVMIVGVNGLDCAKRTRAARKVGIVARPGAPRPAQVGTIAGAIEHIEALISSFKLWREVIAANLEEGEKGKIR